MVAKSNNSTSKTTARKAYQKQILTKAAVLSAVTAQTATSHTITDNLGEGRVPWSSS